MTERHVDEYEYRSIDPDDPWEFRIGRCDEVWLTHCPEFHDSSLTVPTRIDESDQPATIIDAGVFSNDRYLEKLIVSEGYEEIYDSFYGCFNLGRVTLPSSICHLEDDAFSDCGALIISCPYGSYAYDWCREHGITVFTERTLFTESDWERSMREYRADSWAYELGDNGSATVVAYLGDAADVVVPATFDGRPLTKIGVAAFWNCDIESVSLPEGITEIPVATFSGCKSLRTLTLPSSLTSIGKRAFFGCGLRRVDLPKSLESIGDEAFSHCECLQELLVPTGVTHLSNHLLAHCHSLCAISLPEGLQSIGDGTFEYCCNLVEVCVPEGVTSLGDRVFADCNLRKVELPESLRYVGRNVFATEDLGPRTGADECHSVMFVVCNGAVADDYCFEHNIAYGTEADDIVCAFWTDAATGETHWLDCMLAPDGSLSILHPSCNPIETEEDTLRIPSVLCGLKVTEIATGAFAHGLTFRLQDATTREDEDGLAIYSGHLEDDWDWDADCHPKHIILSEGLEELGMEAFFGCDYLESVTIPRSVFAIGERCFDECVNLVVLCHRDSFAHRWCREHGIAWSCAEE